MAGYARNRSLTPPQVIIGQFDPDNFTAEVVDEQTRLLYALQSTARMAADKVGQASRRSRMPRR